MKKLLFLLIAIVAGLGMTYASDTQVDGIWYYFKPDGYMACGEYYNSYWFNSDGSWDEKYFLTWKFPFVRK